MEESVKKAPLEYVTKSRFLLHILFFYFCFTSLLFANPPWEDWKPSGLSSNFKSQVRKPLVPLSGTQTQLHFAFTSDLHGWVSASHFHPDLPPQGLLHIAPILQKLRKLDPELLLLDSGDTLQGSPSAYYYSHVSASNGVNSPLLPIIELMNRLRYDAVVLGNHDFDVPTSILKNMIQKSHFPWLSGNTQIQNTQQLLLPPYRIVERNGVRIGILGLTTPGIPLWNDAKQWKGLKFGDMGKSAAYWTQIIREQEQADWVIGLFHSGGNSKYDGEIGFLQGLSLVNAAGMVSDQISGFDFIVAGHAHQTSPRRKTVIFSRHRTPLIFPGHSARGVGFLSVTFQEFEGRWKSGAMEYQYIRAENQVSKSLMQSLKPRLNTVGQWLHEKTSLQFIRFPERQELEICGVKLTHNALNSIYKTQSFSLLPVWKNVAFPDSPIVTRKHLLRWMPYDNLPVQAELYGRQAELMLEHYRRKTLKRYYRRSGALEPVGFYAILKKKTQNLQLFDESGVPLDPRKTYPFWMSNYHWNGGSGLAGQALLHPSQKIRQEKTHLREVVFQYLQNLKDPLPKECQSFFKIRSGVLGSIGISTEAR